MDKKFLLYLMYSAFIEIREESYENNSKKSFWLSDLLHAVPLQISTDEDFDKILNSLCENAKSLGIEEWINKRKEEFYLRYPEYTTMK